MPQPAVGGSVPEEFGRYQLMRKLATGGMAEIYLARTLGLEGFEKLLVIKRILPHLAENDEFVKMFLDEARIAARLNHPNVVQIFDLGAIGEHFFIAMEYLHGEDARRVWKQSERKERPLPIALACRIVMDAASGLDYAHKKNNDQGQPLGIVHRDVSPQNIIVTFEGGVKVVDFGIAKAADQSSVTRSGVVKGKYSYMSPEQAAGKKVDHRTDLFALGIVLYEMLTGERLFKRNTDIETLKAVERCAVLPPSQLNSRVPSSLDPIVMRALARNLDDRYPDCRAFQVALDEWLVQNRQPSSSAHLASFMREIYAERLAEEQRLGRPLWEDESGSHERPTDKAGSGRRTPTHSHPTTAARRAQSSSLSRQRPVSSSHGALALAPAADPATPAPRTGPHPPPPPPSAFRRSVTNDRKPTVSAPFAIGEDDIVDAGATIATLSEGPTSSTAHSAASEIARRQKRKTLLAGIAGFVVVAGLAGFGLYKLVTPHPVASAGAADPAAEPEVQLSHPAEPAHATHPAQTSPDEVTLAPRSAMLNIATEPAGAEVFINGTSRGKSPLAPVSFPVGTSLKLEARLAGYQPHVETVKVSRDDAVLLRLERNVASAGPAIAAHAELLLDSPMPLVVALDGKPVRLPSREEVKPGRHHIIVSSANLDYNQTLEVNIRAGQVDTPHLTPALGMLHVILKHEDYGDITVGGIAHGQAPGPAFQLAAGPHTVVVTNAQQGKTRKEKVNVVAGQTTTLTLDLSE